MQLLLESITRSDGLFVQHSIIVVLDDLNTHGPGSFYEAFPPSEARRLAARFEFHYTPKQGSWLNMAEIELSALSRTGLDERIPERHLGAPSDDLRTRPGTPEGAKVHTTIAR